MATKKKAKKSAAKATSRKAPAQRAPPPRERLAGFFRKLYKQPALMQKFSASAAGREAVLEKSDLTAEHRNVLATGCLRDIIMALSGADCTVNCTIQCDPGDGGGSLCEHAECHAFRTATKQS